MSVPRRNLSQIKHFLTERRSLLKQRHERVEHDLERRDDPLVADSSDQAIQLQNDETLQAIDDAARSEVAAIDEALQRLEHGLYGTCKRCGEQIEPARLQAVPHAVMCAQCAGS